MLKIIKILIKELHAVMNQLYEMNENKTKTLSESNRKKKGKNKEIKRNNFFDLLQEMLERCLT